MTLTHVLADTLPEFAVIGSALAALWGRCNASHADAVGALVTSAMILLLLGMLARGLWLRFQRFLFNAAVRE